MEFIFKKEKFFIERYPKTDNKSLKAWSSADEHILNYIKEHHVSIKNLIIYNDRFGFLSTVLSKHKPTTILNFKSQEKAIDINLKKNESALELIQKISPLENLKNNFDLALIKIPKSLDLFQLQLNQLHNSIDKESIVICAFMTKYFTRKILSIAHEYFDICEQSLAWKKSRLLTLRKKKKRKKEKFIHTIPFSGTKTFKQYYGVFSSKNIDYATQFFIENMKVKSSDNKILDMACGNGILAHAALKKTPNSEVYLLDDSMLALASSKMNISSKKAKFYLNDTLNDFDDNTFDLIISNPPFHFEHETNIEISLHLFKEAKRCLKKGGSFQLVTSNHLNSKTHLHKLFHKVQIIAQNNKFMIYNCF